MSNFQLSDKQASDIAKAIYADIQAFCDEQVLKEVEVSKE